MKKEIKIKTRDSLLKAALRVFTEKGYRGASIREIAEEAKTTKPAIYYYFGSKALLYRLLLEESLKEINSLLQEIADSNAGPREKILRLVKLHLDLCRRRPENIRLILVNFYRFDDELPEIELEEHILRMLKITAGVIREGIEKKLLLRLDPMELSLQLMGMIHVQVLAMIKGKNLVPVSRAETIVKTFIEGAGR